MGGRGSSSMSYSFTSSEYDSAGKVPMLSNDKIGAAGNYQGSNMGSGRASDSGRVTDAKTLSDIDRMLARAPKVAQGNDEAIAQLESLRAGAEYVTVYRATPGDSINHGDWVFMSEGLADTWARTTFGKAPKPGYRVIKAKVPARSVAWTGKNLEFQVI